MNAYITGSRAYGYPREDSDVDLVVLCSEADCKIIWKQNGYGRLQFGIINLVLFNADNPTDLNRYHKWKKAHDSLVARAPVTKEEAILCFREAGAESIYFQGGKK